VVSFFLISIVRRRIEKMDAFFGGLIIGIFIGGATAGSAAIEGSAERFNTYCKSFGATHYKGECVKIEKVVP